MLRKILSACSALPLLFPHLALAASDADLAIISAEIQQLKQLRSADSGAGNPPATAENTAKAAQSTAAKADEKASQVAVPQPASSSGANAFNPGIRSSCPAPMPTSRKTRTNTASPASFRAGNRSGQARLQPGGIGVGHLRQHRSAFLRGGLNLAMAADNSGRWKKHLSKPSACRKASRSRRAAFFRHRLPQRTARACLGFRRQPAGLPSLSGYAIESRWRAAEVACADWKHF